MRIAQVFNNNVVLALDEANREVILTGRGLGFQARPGQLIDEALVIRTFVPPEPQSAQQFGALLADIPPEHIALADEALNIARSELSGVVTASVVISFADHLSFAVKRARQDISVAYPLRAEIAHLYPREMRLAELMVAFVNQRLPAPIPAGEAIAFALHLVNAGFATGDLSSTYQMTTLFGQIFEVLESSYERCFDTETISAARFITHLRYFFVRATSGTQFADETSGLSDAMRSEQPTAFQCAVKIKTLLELRLGHPVSDSELVYLTIHVARLANESC